MSKSRPKPKPGLRRTSDESERARSKWLAKVARARLAGFTKATAEGTLAAYEATMPDRVDEVPGRNDPCPCRSGKKWKRCHGA